MPDLPDKHPTKATKVCVVSGDDRQVLTGLEARASYPSLTYEINRRFCEAKGWDFRFEHYRLPRRPWGSISAYCASSRQHRAASWIKLLAVLRALELGYTQVIWIDSDCIFYNHDADWSDFLALFQRDGVQIAGWIDRPFHADQICAGFFGVSNSPEIKALLKELWLRRSNTSSVHPYEQAELVRELRAKPLDWSRLIDEPMFNLEVQHQRLLHVASHDHGLRLKRSLGWFSDRNLDPEPRATDVHVHADLNIDAADLGLSQRRPGLLEQGTREIWCLRQFGLRHAKSMRTKLLGRAK